MTFAEGFRAAAVLAWLFSPPIFVALAMLAWLRARRSGTVRRTALAGGLGVLAMGIWIVFAIFLSKAQTPYGQIFQTSTVTHVLLLLCVLAAPASLVLPNCGWRLFCANLLLITLWVGIAYAPSHFLRHWGYGKLTINRRPTAASIFIAHPWDSEAEAIVLVHASATEDFFLSFGEVRVHVSSSPSYIRVPGGVWSFTSLREMTFEDPLPATQMNEFRFKSRKGAVVSVQF